MVGATVYAWHTGLLLRAVPMHKCNCENAKILNNFNLSIPSCAILPRNILHFRAHRWVNINLCTFWRLHLCRGTARGSSAVCHAWSVTPTIHHLPNSPKILSFSKSIDCYLLHSLFALLPFTSFLYENKIWKLHSLRFGGMF